MFVLTTLAGHVGPRCFDTRKQAQGAAKFYSRKFRMTIKVVDYSDLVHDLWMQSLVTEYWSALPTYSNA